MTFQFRILLLSVTLFLGCDRGEGAISIGIAAPLTGEVASYGERVRNASRLAEDEINSSGGIRGRTLRLVFEDTRCDPATGVSAARKLYQVDKVSVILGGTCSSVTLAMAPVAEAARRVQPANVRSRRRRNQERRSGDR